MQQSDPTSHGAIAQLGERIVRNDEVVGSIPTSSTNLLNHLAANLRNVCVIFDSVYCTSNVTGSIPACSTDLRAYSAICSTARFCPSGTNCAYIESVVDTRE